MHDLEYIKAVNKTSTFNADNLLNKKCTVVMPDGTYTALVVNITDTTVDIKLDNHKFMLTVYLGRAINNFKDSYPDLPEFYAC